MKKILIMGLAAIMIVTCIACKTGLKIPDEPKLTEDENTVITDDAVRVAKMYKDVVEKTKKACEENGYKYKLYDFSDEYEYKYIPNMKIEKCFDYDGDENSVSLIKRIYEKAMGDVPDQIKKLLKDSGVIVHFVLDANDYWTGKKLPLNLNGMYSPEDNKIYIACGSDYKLHVAESHVIWHELGHALDNYFGAITKKDEFMGIYNEEADWDAMSNGVHNPAEWFADMFSLYLAAYTTEYDVIHKKTLTEKAPKTYAFFVKTFDFPEI